MAQASYWTVEEVDLSADMRDWIRLTGVHVGTIGGVFG
jgi:ribonucleotide reductase beta subunit family protein with ferritin-like domain